MLALMRQGGVQREVEIKLALTSAAAARRRLVRYGFRAIKRRTLQSDAILDTAAGRLRRAGALLRLRRAGRCGWLTFKGRAITGRHKSREEIELAVDSNALSQIELILARLGFRPVFRYEKYRTEYRRGRQGGVVALDETPIGAFLELEGPPGWIDRTARELGFTPADYITATYAELYVQDCKRRGVKPGHMLFARD